VLFQQWLVGVAEHDYVGLHEVDFLLEFTGKALGVAEDVNHEDPQAAKLQGFLFVYPRRRVAFVDIAPNGRHWSDSFELAQHLEISNVACMKYVADAFERLGNLGIEPPVRVRNDPNQVLIHCLPFR
jgi:hypothetical protein